ncbi:MAG: FAD-dependent oxidoreductase [Firmicutes bacterium]|nr:FAD-dependent oxidoreductase [Bacillota bacterium]
MRKPVLVLGGGIAGIQASLDLAEMGIPVYLVEKSPSIGGRMAQLDKTFPTNDCSACILAPKVTACFNHPLIKAFTYSELIKLQGEAPHFTALVRKRARFIDEELCKGCNDCAEKCPIRTPSEFEMKLGQRKAIYKPFAQAVPNKAVIDKKGTSPCKFRCPAHIDTHGYIALTGEGRYEEALELVRRVTPFAGVLGRVCFHPCESQCSRQYVDEPLAIASIKRFIADTEIERGVTPSLQKKGQSKAHKVAIAGSGPAGLNCAYQLALLGYPVTVFEALPVPGGMLRVGIPDYRLNKRILDREIRMIEGLGVEIRLNTPVGKDLTIDTLREQGYQAFFLAIGAHLDQKLGIPGEETPGVVPGVKLLREINLGQKPVPPLKALVIGGGNVAMDAARSLIRLGCEVTVVYRRGEAELPANPWEIEQAREEGARFEFLTAPVAVLNDGQKVTGLKCVRNRLGAPDASGRRRPEAVPGSEFILEAGWIVPAIGQVVNNTDLRAAGYHVFDKNGRIKTDPDSPDIFAGGDAATGPATMIEAIAAGNKAAIAIHNFLQGTELPLEPALLPETPIEAVGFAKIAGRGRVKRAMMPLLDINQRRTSFAEVELGFSAEQARAEALRCVDCSICSECKACETACQSQAIRHEQKDELLGLPVSAVIIAAGGDVSGDLPPEFGYGSSPNIVTSMEYERILAASGPFQGHVQRPSDGMTPNRIAFIQCAGSRDQRCQAEYCSAVCCMYAVKEAVITREHLPSVRDIDIFYMDIRAYGKDFDYYVATARSKYGIGFIKSRVAEIAENKATGKIGVKYCGADGRMAVAEYDLVVLAVGFVPKAELQPFLAQTGIKTGRFGFCWINEMEAPNTSRTGITACGVAAGPKDIPETVVEASAAAAAAARIALKTDLGLGSGTEANGADFCADGAVSCAGYFQVEAPAPLRDVTKEPPRIGVFLCHCGINIGGYLDVKAVAEYARSLPFVEFTEDFLYACSVDAQKTMMERIKEYQLNRVVVASCTPRTHEPLFQSLLAKTGLNPYLFNMANIRDQCSWAHMEHFAEATQKAKDLVRMAAGKAAFAKPLIRQKIEVQKQSLVIGGGIAGMTAALELAGMGYQVYLVEKSGRLGGNALKINSAPSGRLYWPYFQKYIQETLQNPLIEVFLNARIRKVDGYVGKYATVLDTPRGEEERRHGVIIVATGAREYRPVEYLYGDNPKVITQLDLEERLHDNSLNFDKIKKVTMIQCVGSRDDKRPYCSRVCCNQAIRNALYLKEQAPDLEIAILYRDLRAYGFYEINYRAARQAGVRFISYPAERRPELVEESGRLWIRVWDPILGRELQMESDLVVLAAAIEAPRDENRALAQMLKVPLNQDGFFLEAHVKLRPVDFATDGVYLCGLAHAPKNIKESMIQGKAAAARAATVISKNFLETEGTVAQVTEDLCAGCGVCEKVCAYGAIAVQAIRKRNETVKKAVVNPALCKGCGTCSANCRCGAVDLNGFTDRQVLAEIECLLMN